MDFVFYSHPTFEPWDWTNPVAVGIGGSETSHIEMARRLSERGHFVKSYAPIPDQNAVVSGPGCVSWEHSHRVKMGANPKAISIIYRHPEILDQLPAGRAAWLIFQDVHYGGSLTEARAHKLTRLVALCETHAAELRRLYPFAADKVCVSSNGITPLVMDDLSAGSSKRNPRRLMYASSPDRGLNQLLQIFGRVKEIIPDAELHIYYGWDNIDKVIAKGDAWSQEVERRKNYTMSMIARTGAVWHGRTGQNALTAEWLKAGIWCHPSNFTETSCITCMDAQALGAIPVTIPTWAVGENVQYGIFVEGNAQADAMVRSRFVLELIRLMLNPDRQAAIRNGMMPWARRQFDWSNFVDQWESWAAHDLHRIVGAARREMVNA